MAKHFDTGSSPVSAYLLDNLPVQEKWIHIFFSFPIVQGAVHFSYFVQKNNTALIF